MGESNIDVLTANRMYKSRIFAMLFSDRNELLKLYNAITDKVKAEMTRIFSR